MDIQINSCPVNYELENERVVADVVKSISSWARERDLIFVEARIDDASFNIDRIPDIPLDRVGRLNCIVQSKSEVVISSLEEGIGYCNKAESFISESLSAGHTDLVMVDALAGGVEWLAETMKSVFSLLGVKPEEVAFRDGTAAACIAKLHALRDGIPGRKAAGQALLLLGDNRTTFADVREIFRMMLMSENLRDLVIQSIDSPSELVNTIMDIRSGLDRQREDLAKAAAAYQAGRDDEAAEKIHAFIDFIYRYTRSCFQVAPVFQVDLTKMTVDGVSLDEKNRKIGDLLNEMLIAFENNDIISLADILEYELSPALQNLDAYFDELQKAIQG